MCEDAFAYRNGRRKGCINTSDTVYSFSRLSAFEQCKYQYYLNYLLPPDQRPPKTSNAFSVYGGFVHSIIEKYANGELAEFELLDKYVDEFDIQVNIDFPPNAYADLRKSYFDGSYTYFENFDGFAYLGGTHILGVEQEFTEDFGDFKLRGFIDLILSDQSEDIIIVDHKSKKEIKTKKDKLHYGRQPLLYSHYIKSKYGKPPSKMIFNMFRSGSLLEIPYSEAAYQESVQWAKSQIMKIENTSEWTPQPDQFYCSFLCDYRETCQYKPESVEC